jgi:CheY-like chemotaxis protein
VSQVFARSEKLEDQIQEIRLKIPEWKILFTIDGVMTSDKMADFLEIEEEEVLETLKKLKDMQLISEVEEQLVDEESEETLSPEFEETDFEREEIATEDENAPEEKEVIEGRIEISGEETTEELKEEEEGDLFSISEETTEESTEFGLMKEETTTKPEEKEEETLAESDEVEDEIFAETDKKEDEALSDQEFDKFIGGLLNEEEDKESVNLESAEPTLDSEAPPEIEEEKKESGMDFGNFFQEELPEAEVETEEEKLEIKEEEEKEIEEKLPEALEEKVEGKGKTILVVDDSVVIRKMVEIALENEQFNIVSVATGKDALKYLDENDPNLIILDIMLPDVNGLDVLKAVKASKQQIPVVMLSAKDTPRETSKAKELGANDFIPKPFKDEELVSKINELVRG